VQVLPSEAFDPKEAEQRIAARRQGLEKEIERFERRLANQGFVSKAPPSLVEGERHKLEEARQALQRLEG
jgi:valyl-tRNA synthetase